MNHKIRQGDEMIISLEKREIDRSRIETKKDEDIAYFRNLANQYEKQIQIEKENSYILTTERNIKSKYSAIPTEDNNTSFENFRRNKEIRLSTLSEIDLARKYSDTYFYKNEN
jgi:hypothetical protein